MTEPAEDAPEATEETSEAPEVEVEEVEEADTEDAWDPKRAKEKIRKQNLEIQAAKERLSKAPKAEDLQEKDKRIGDLESANLKLEVAFDLGLPKEIAKRLQGDTREEMLKDAESLLELVSPAKRPATSKPTEKLRGGGDPEKEPEETDLKKLGARMFSR